MGNTSERRFRNSTGPYIQKARLKLGLTQEEFAAKLQLAGFDIDRFGVAKIESRVRSVFDFELALIGRVLGVDVTDLMPSAAELKRTFPHLRKGVLSSRPKS
jgi:transcriptional regulator with XRE-family HTH domain